MSSSMFYMLKFKEWIKWSDQILNTFKALEFVCIEIKPIATSRFYIITWSFGNQDTYQNSPSCSNFNPIFSHSDLLILDHSGELQNIKQNKLNNIKLKETRKTHKGIALFSNIKKLHVFDTLLNVMQLWYTKKSV